MDLLHTLALSADNHGNLRNCIPLLIFAPFVTIYVSLVANASEKE